MNNTWNQNEFLAFTLIYGAHADMEFSSQEKEEVQKLVTKEKYLDLYNLFNGMSDYKALELIMDYKELYYPTTSQKNDLLDKLENLFKSDGDFSSLEKQLHLFLEKIL